MFWSIYGAHRLPNARAHNRSTSSDVPERGFSIMTAWAFFATTSRQLRTRKLRPRRIGVVVPARRQPVRGSSPGRVLKVTLPAATVLSRLPARDAALSPVDRARSASRARGIPRASSGGIPVGTLGSEDEAESVPESPDISSINAVGQSKLANAWVVAGPQSQARALTTVQPMTRSRSIPRVSAK